MQENDKLNTLLKNMQKTKIKASKAHSQVPLLSFTFITAKDKRYKLLLLRSRHLSDKEDGSHTCF